MITMFFLVFQDKRHLLFCRYLFLIFFGFFLFEFCNTIRNQDIIPGNQFLYIRYIHTVTIEVRQYFCQIFALLFGCSFLRINRSRC